VLRIVGVGVSALGAFTTGLAMAAEWPTLALFWYAPHAQGSVVDPIFSLPLNFFLFALPAWHLIAGWLLMLERPLPHHRVPAADHCSARVSRPV
jgi:uncharacterized membrane protein (UPF0182 family)